jgi:hypothetical protein
MLRRLWNAFLDAIESVVEFIAYLTGPGRRTGTPPDLGKPKPIRPASP